MAVPGLLALFGISSTALIAAVAWLIRSLTKHLLDKDVEKFKESLKSEYAKELERAKAELSKELHEHNLSYNNLIAKRAEWIDTVRPYLSDMIMSARRYICPVEEDTLLKAKEFLAAHKSARKAFFHEYNRRSYYFPKSLQDIINKLDLEFHMERFSYVENEPLISELRHAAFLDWAAMIKPIAEQFDAEIRRCLNIRDYEISQAGEVTK